MPFEDSKFRTADREAARRSRRLGQVVEQQNFGLATSGQVPGAHIRDELQVIDQTGTKMIGFTPTSELLGG